MARRRTATSTLSISPAPRRVRGADLQAAAAENVKRVYVPRPDADWAAVRVWRRLNAFVETKTVWHPIGV